MNTPYWFSNLAYWSAQVALLVLAAGFLPHIFKIRQPRILLIYWRALIAAALILPLAQPWHRPEIPGTITFAPPAGDFTSIVIDAPAPVVTHSHLPTAQTIAAAIGLILLAGIAIRFTILALGLLKLRQFRRASSPISNHAESAAVLDDMRIRVNTSGEFRISSDVESPVTFGLSAPVILLPERFPSLDVQYQSTIACHELLHVRRGDWAHHLSEEILRAALWFHPAIAWLISRVRLSREQVVDLEVIKLTGARKPYLEALLEFTNSRALATAIPAPPFLVERQLAERVALMLKEVRMSRTRLIASLTAIAVSLALVATLAIWTFPLKAAARPQQNPPQGGIVQGVSGGIIGGVTGGVVDGVPAGISGNVPGQGVKDGVSAGVKNAGPDTITDSYASPTPRDSGVLVGPIAVSKLPKAAAASPQVLGPKIIVADIKFIGEVHDADAVRARILKGVEGKVWDGNNNEWLDEIAEVGVRGDFQNHGYFEAIIDGVKSQVLDSTGGQERVLAIFNVKEGDQFRAGDFTFIGFDPSRGPVIPVSDLRAQFHLQTGDILNTDELRHGIQSVTDLYGSRGYLDFKATPKFSIDHRGHTVAMVLTLAEGIQYHVASFVVHGLDSNITANLESKVRPGTVLDWPLLRALFEEGKVASGANVRWVEGIHVTRHPDARTVDISFDFPANPSPSPAPTNSNDSRYIGKFQYIPPAVASSGTVQNIPPFVTSPPRGVLTVGPPTSEPPPPTNQGVFLNVAPSAPANSPDPNPQNISNPINRAGTNGVTGPVCDYCPHPEYSQQARDAKIQGTVYLQVEVLTTGRPSEITVIKGLEESLDKEAIKIIRDKWTFKPATDQNGNPVNAITPIQMTFQLFGPPQPTPQTTGRSAAASPTIAPLTSNESLEAKIFKGPVADNGAYTPSYMGVVFIQPILTPRPELPRLARQSHVQGSVTLNIIVNAEGKVIVVEYVKGPAMLVQSAIDTVRNWIIKGTHEGAPVAFQMSVEVTFADK
jgi:TonB family protein